MTHKCCSPPCALEWVKLERERKERKDTRKRKEALKTRTQWLKEAQIEFNRFIRQRDADLPCISCGRHARNYDAGHYRTVGAAPQLRFDEENVHKQCIHCNQYKSGNLLEYRIGLLAKIGPVAVERLELDHSIKKWTIDDAKAIKAHYRARLVELVNGEAA